LKREILGLHPPTQNSKTPETQLKLHPFVQIPNPLNQVPDSSPPSKFEKSCKSGLSTFSQTLKKGAASIINNPPQKEKKKPLTGI
jgi:hypothetical protein